jgi:hypothetical protein
VSCVRCLPHAPLAPPTARARPLLHVPLRAQACLSTARTMTRPRSCRWTSTRSGTLLALPAVWLALSSTPRSAR